MGSQPSSVDIRMHARADLDIHFPPDVGNLVMSYLDQGLEHELFLVQKAFEEVANNDANWARRIANEPPQRSNYLIESSFGFGGFKSRELYCQSFFCVVRVIVVCFSLC